MTTAAISVYRSNNFTVKDRPPIVTMATTKSEETLKFIERRLVDCDENHPLCASSRPSSRWYPTRLIDVMASKNVPYDHVQLFITAENSPTGPYASLSHCWGIIEIITLTEARMREFSKTGIAISRLPQTFRDAINVARSLNIRYIWIDSLCIIQDSIADWNVESRTMLQVYQHAYCNIAATHAKDGRGGLFANRNPNLLSTDVQFSYGRATAFYRMTNMNNGYWQLEIDDAPLNRRAWVVQERLISPRIIHFGSEQVIWDCYESVACESFPEGTTAWSTRDSASMYQSPKQSSQLMVVPENTDQALGKWAAIIAAYSSCALTYQKDKIVAISGVVELLADLWKVEYCAGLWRKNLEFQLCWLTHKPMAGVARPPSQSRAPSWSWLAFDGIVEASQLQMSTDEGYEVTMRATVTEVSLRNEVSDSDGEVIVGHLRLYCTLNPVIFDTGSGEYCFVGRDGSLLPILRIDFDNAVRSHGEELYFIPLYDLRYQTRQDSPSKDASDLRGIIAKVMDRALGIYTRCGHVYQNGRVAGEGHNQAFVDLTIPQSKEKLPCVEYDAIQGHLITLI
jgi:hypothetical protein